MNNQIDEKTQEVNSQIELNESYSFISPTFRLSYDAEWKCIIAEPHIEPFVRIDFSVEPYRWRKKNGIWQLFLPVKYTTQERLDSAKDFLFGLGAWMSVDVDSFKVIAPDNDWFKDRSGVDDEKYVVYEVFKAYLYDKRYSNRYH